MNIHYKLLGSLLWIKSNDLENDINELGISGLVFGIASTVPWKEVLISSHTTQGSLLLLRARSDPLHDNSFSGAILTPYSGVILTPKRSLKNSFSGVKVTPDIEELK